LQRFPSGFHRFVVAGRKFDQCAFVALNQLASGGGGARFFRVGNLWNQQQDPTAHAEMVAIRRFLADHGLEKLKGTTLYASGESCPVCMGAIIWCGIARVVYGASIAELATRVGQIMITDADIAAKTPFADIVLTGGVLADESLKLFK